MERNTKSVLSVIYFIYLFIYLIISSNLFSLSCLQSWAPNLYWKSARHFVFYTHTHTYIPVLGRYPLLPVTKNRRFYVRFFLNQLGLVRIGSQTGSKFQLGVFFFFLFFIFILLLLLLLLKLWSILWYSQK